MPNIQSLSDFRQNATAMIKQVNETSNPLYLTQNGKSTAVVVSREVWENTQKSLAMLRLLTILDGQDPETDVPFDHVLDELDDMVNAHGQ